ncbi:MAG: hypothetical protein R2838_01700 [Caldilineaceae bacterium]
MLRRGQGLAVFGHTQGGTFALRRARSADYCALSSRDGSPGRRGDTRQIQAAGRNAASLHVATHAAFNNDGSLADWVLDDGWLTTLDIFGLKLTQTWSPWSVPAGRSVLGGGDELRQHALSRRCGIAPACSGRWRTARPLLMEAVYRSLADGASKVDAPGQHASPHSAVR